MRQLSEREQADFDRDGVVHVPGALDGGTVHRLTAAVDRVLAPRPGDDADTRRGDGAERRLHHHDPEWRSFLHQTPLASLAAQATRSSTMRIYFDQIFVKEPELDAEFAWHQDHPFWAVGGSQVVSTWVALTPATVAGSALEFVAGSHAWGRTYRPVLASGTDRASMNRLWDGFGDRAHAIPDEIIPFEDHPDRFRVVGFAVEPGDALLFDYRILHRSRANTTDRRRVAVSWRWLGDDATWRWQRGADPVVGPADTDLAVGDRIVDDAAFPLIHPRPSD